MHVCIVTPRHLSANPRVVKEAAALHDAGLIVTIVCGDYIPGKAKLDRELLATRDCNLVPVPFGRKVAPLTVHLRQRAKQMLARMIFRAGLGPAYSQITAHAPITGDLMYATCEIHADLYIAHYVAALPAVAAAANLHGGLYAFDAEDFHLGDLPDEREHALEKAIILSIEQRWLPGAAYTTAASPLIARAYAETYGVAEPTVILNVCPRSHAPLSHSSYGTAVPRPSLYWFSQTIGQGRGLETALEAVALATTQPHLHLRGIPAAGYRDRLTDLATRLRVADRLHFHEPVSPVELERVGSAFDVGLAGETGFSRNNSMAVANKLFSYISSGLPVIASKTPAQVEIALRLEGVVSLFGIGDAPGLACQLDALLVDAGTLASKREKAWGLGQSTFSWEAEAPRLVECVMNSLGAHPKRRLI